MTNRSTYRTLATQGFKRDTRRFIRTQPRLRSFLDELLASLEEDPYNSSRQHDIKKLTGVKPGRGQWRIRSGDYRLRYDIFGTDVLYSLRHRKEAY